jgi:hypothetical protein
MMSQADAFPHGFVLTGTHHPTRLLTADRVRSIDNFLLILFEL